MVRGELRTDAEVTTELPVDHHSAAQAQRAEDLVQNFHVQVPAGGQSGVSIKLSGTPIILANCRLAYIGAVNFGNDSPVVRKSPCHGVEELVLKTRRGLKMFDMDDSLRTRRIMTFVFAILSGVSAVSTAVVPGILHI